MDGVEQKCYMQEVSQILILQYAYRDAILIFQYAYV